MFAIFKDRLKYLRESNNLTQSELSKILDLTPAAIGLYEQGRRFPDLNTLQRIADYFDVSADYLLCREDTFQANSMKRQLNEISFSGGIIFLNNASISLTSKQKKALSKAVESILEIIEEQNKRKRDNRINDE